eukprot:1560861-Karenia_brevis.AAC.1
MNQPISEKIIFQGTAQPDPKKAKQDGEGGAEKTVPAEKAAAPEQSPWDKLLACLLYTSPSPRDTERS